MDRHALLSTEELLRCPGAAQREHGPHVAYARKSPRHAEGPPVCRRCAAELLSRGLGYAMEPLAPEQKGAA